MASISTFEPSSEIHSAMISEPPVMGFRGEDSSGVSWGAVIGGAFAAASLALILIALGAGFGLALVSPWSNAGSSASKFGAGAILWMIIVEGAASAMGGYLAGRLRTKWTLIHSDEVHFRDTANGFLTWAVALVMTAAFLATAGVYMAGETSAGETAAVNAAAHGADTGAYFIDRLFRSPAAQSDGDLLARAEAARILSIDLHRPDFPQVDRAYLTQLVMTRTGLNGLDAQRRVNDTVIEVKETEDVARKAGARLLLWSFVALLFGAFCASYAATIGGRQRDHVKPAVR